MVFTYDTPTISEIRSGKNVGSAIRRNTYDALGGYATQDKLFLFGFNFGDTASALRITIMDKHTGQIQACESAKYHNAAKANEREHSHAIWRLLVNS